MPQTNVEAHGLAPNSLSKSESPVTGILRGPRRGHFVERSFVELFEQQAQQHPEKLAVIAGNTQLTYAELNERADELAQRLCSQGAGPESLVGICVDRSLEMAIGIVGILKSGGAYLPLDPEYPRERLAFMIRDARPAVIVTKSNLVAEIPAAAARLVLIEDHGTASSPASQSFAALPRPTDLAYVIYTSGSTGQPKGVCVEHGNLANYLLALNDELEIRDDDVYLHLASIAFSSSRRQLLLPLSQGATVLIADANQRKDPLKLFETIKARGVTVMDAVPSFWRSCTTILQELDESDRRELLDHKLRLMLSASEPLTADIPRTWLKNFRHPARHFHMFGQTETAGIVCVNEISADGDDERVPIGRPMANTEIQIVDENLKPRARGQAGELLIGGAGVGRGYLNRPDLTAEKFITTEHGRFYRTGDFARLREDGKLEFAGRRDQQIKIRGMRVELAEVEMALAAHPAVRECAVVAKTDAQQNTCLVAYFVPHGDAPSAAELRAFLVERVPEHAAPSGLIELSALPLSANGKVDRRALIEHRDSEAPKELKTRIAPTTEAEQQLVSIFREVLRIDQIGIDDNFFELGGNSLLAGQAIARVRRAFKVDAPITWLFESTTIREFAARFDSAAKDESIAAPIRRVSRSEPLPLSSAQHRLWFLDQLEPNGHTYNLAHALEIRGALDVDALRRSFDALAERHEILRTRFIDLDGVPYQRIDLPARADWQLIDLSQLPRDRRDAEANHLLKAESRKPFDLGAGPLMRIRALRMEAEKFILLLTFHHIVSDGWSAKVLADDLGAFYHAFTQNTRPPGAELPVQYADYAVWQQSVAHGALASQVNFWKEQLGDAPQILNLPTDHVRSAELSDCGAKETACLSADAARGLRAFSRAHDATLFMTLLAVFNAQLARYTGDRDIVVGTPVAGRTRVETEPLIGMFVNTLPLRVKVSAEQTVRELIGSVRATSLAAYANQDVPFETLVNELQYDRASQHHPIFQVMFALQNARTPMPRLANLEVQALDLHTEKAKFDLSLEVIDESDELQLAVTYRTDLFAPNSARRMLADFQLLLEAFVANPEQRLDDLPALTWTPKQLPAQTAVTTSAAPALYIAPQTPIEEKLAAIWTEVLSIDRIGVEDNFFMLGGHSLMATQLIGRIRNAFSYELPLRQLFQTPTISGLANAIAENQAANAARDELDALLAELEGLTEEEALMAFAEEKAA